jgi:tetratricopeptide (TPR) repeat protein
MALYGLGKIDANLADRRDDDVQLTRRAMTMYSAALASCPDNHLAANELGVLTCRAGRAAEAVRLFERTIDFAPSALAYHNLAMAQRKLGMSEPAAANEYESQRLAAAERARGEVSRRAGVQWVTPAAMARANQPGAWTAITANHRPVAEPPARTAWQRTADFTKSLPRPGRKIPQDGLGPMAGDRLARPTETPATKQLQWR